MRTAVTFGPHDVRVVNADPAAPGFGQATIQIERVGICGSDLHLYHGSHPYAVFPRIQGHELSGRIVEYGPETDPHLPIGTRVAIEPLIPCGDCYPCRIGRRNCCVSLKVIGAHVDGGLRQFVPLHVSMLFAAEGLDADLAALVEPISIGVQAVARADVQAGEQVLVVGAGPIGVAVCLAAFDRGGRVAVVDRLPNRLALATTFGAELTIDASKEDVDAAVREWTNGEGPPVAVDAVGAPAVIQQCCRLVASAGRVVIVGLSDHDVGLPILDFTRKEMTILGSRNNAGRFAQALDLTRRHAERVRTMITHRFLLEETPAALAFAAEHPAEVEKVMIEVWNA